MRRELVLSVMIILASGSITTFIITPVHSASNIKVGLYYYVWYEEYGRGHWDWTVLDKPILGYYNSSERFLIETHFGWFESLDIDFVIVSYWGWFESAITYNSTQAVFDVVESLDTSVKLCIMIEPTGENETADNFNFTWIYNDIYDKYATRQCYFRWEGKPLLLYYNADNMTKDGSVPEDNRFTQLIAGHQEYADWIYSAPCWEVKQQVRNRQISVMPAYDDSHFRKHNQTHDVCYENEMYVRQWERVLSEAWMGNIDVVTVATWNEWHERTSIEPHFRNGCDVSFFHAYNLTKDYIHRLRTYNNFKLVLEEIRDELAYIRNLMYVFIATTVIFIATTVYFAIRKPKVKP